MDEIAIRYRFDLAEDQSETFDLRLDGNTLELIVADSSEPPEWARLEYMQCPHCPLKSDTHPYCPVAVSLSGVISRFGDVFSHDELDLQVITDERTVSRHTTAQRAISALLGLLFATSGCPHTNYLKPMARFHLPLASEEETIFRSAGMYLLAQYFLRKEGKEGDLDLKGLTKIYENLHQVNKMIAERIRSSTQADASVNAVILLDMFTNLMPFVIEDHLDEIRHLYEAYLS